MGRGGEDAQVGRALTMFYYDFMLIRSAVKKRILNLLRGSDPDPEI